MAKWSKSVKEAQAFIRRCRQRKAAEQAARDELTISLRREQPGTAAVQQATEVPLAAPGV